MNDFKPSYSKEEFIKRLEQIKNLMNHGYIALKAGKKKAAQMHFDNAEKVMKSLDIEDRIHFFISGANDILKIFYEQK